MSELTLHGHRVTYREAGEGDSVLVLLHGIASASDTWREVMPWLAERHTVIAPDLLGHGESAKPRGDYSLGAYASGVRDLLAALGHERFTLVGHSLGGGVAMQFAYQFPEPVERLVLVCSGGLGRSVHPALRAASLPGAELVLPVIAPGWLARAGARLGGALGKLGLRPAPDLGEFLRGYASLSDAGSRAAFLATVRGVIDPGGQRVDARDRLYLAETVPTLLIWGERDPIIPVGHGRAAHAAIPQSRLVEMADAGHFPHLDDPHGFVEVLEQFIAETEPATYDEDEIRRLLRTGGAA